MLCVLFWPSFLLAQCFSLQLFIVVANVIYRHRNCIQSSTQTHTNTLTPVTVYNPRKKMLHLRAHTEIYSLKKCCVKANMHEKPNENRF